LWTKGPRTVPMLTSLPLEGGGQGWG